MEVLVAHPSSSFGRKEEPDIDDLDLDELYYAYDRGLCDPDFFYKVMEYVRVRELSSSPSSFCKETPDPYLRGSTSVSSAVRKLPGSQKEKSDFDDQFDLDELCYAYDRGLCDPDLFYKVMEYVHVHKHSPSRSSFCKETPDPSLRGSTSVSSAVRKLPGSSLSSSVRELCDANLPIPSASAGETSLPVKIMSPALVFMLNHSYLGDCQPMDIDVAVDEEQRTNLFFGRAYVHGKLSTIVIDSGSCTNIIGESLVTELGLPLTDHPRPYILTGINGAGMLVSKISRVLITVQDYRDYLELDVVPTSAVHVLLGRPWQFDLGVKHDGYRNEYTFAKNEMPITLLPLTPIQIDQLRAEIRGADMAAGGNGQN